DSIERDPEFERVLRQHKPELIRWLTASWLHVARQILDGEFVGADRSTRESLTIGLRSIAHPLCRRALGQITSRKGEQTNENTASNQ
ncbi:MAG TPA: hypothetical protein VNT99_11505, partial [Methylomirabilota bacterium]|nr:hypothetical protein [Methylomirabilota bacterium]